MRTFLVLFSGLILVVSGYAQTFTFTADTVVRYGMAEDLIVFHAVFENLLNDTQSIHFHADPYDFPDTNWTLGICAGGGCFPPGMYDVDFVYDSCAIDSLVSFDIRMTEIGDSGHFSATLISAQDPEHPQTIHFTIRKGVDFVTLRETIPELINFVTSYPNPFNNSTTLEFSIARFEPTELIIYDILGREVATVLDGERLSPGIHRLHWSATNNNGFSLPSGVYFARLRVQDEQKTHQLYLVR
jgi:hypothetical protein